MTNLDVEDIGKRKLTVSGLVPPTGQPEPTSAPSALSVTGDNEL